jgi:mannose-1-phosphate guanylyltransferase
VAGESLIGTEPPGIKTYGNTWTALLVAGEGSRLHALTKSELGVAVPKQFCSLRVGNSSLRETLERAHNISSRENTCVVVARQVRAQVARGRVKLPMLGFE